MGDLLSWNSTLMVLCRLIKTVYYFHLTVCVCNMIRWTFSVVFWAFRFNVSMLRRFNVSPLNSMKTRSFAPCRIEATRKSKGQCLNEKGGTTWSASSYGCGCCHVSSIKRLLMNPACCSGKAWFFGEMYGSANYINILASVKWLNIDFFRFWFSVRQCDWARFLVCQLLFSLDIFADFIP